MPSALTCATLLQRVVISTMLEAAGGKEDLMSREKLNIDRKFRILSLPYSMDDFRKLRENVLRKGCIEPIAVWNGVILDGHKRYEICSEYGVDFEVREMSFEFDEEAVIWACRQRIKKFDKNNPYHRYLIGEWYIAQKSLNKKMRKCKSDKESFQTDEPDKYAEATHFQDTSAWLGDKVGTTRSIVQVGGDYAAALEKMAETNRVLFEAILRDEVKYGYNKVIEMTGIKENTYKDKSTDKGKSRSGQKSLDPGRMRNRERADRKNNGTSTSFEIPLNTGIKEMPEFDPDLEINGLMLTIPTWIHQMSRVERKTDISLTTENARMQLRDTLCSLKEQVDRMISFIDMSREAGKQLGTALTTPSHYNRRFNDD